MKTLAELKSLYKLLTGKNSTAKTIAGVVKELNTNLTVTIDGTTKALTIKVKS